MSVTSQNTKSLPHHLISMPGGEWALWRWTGLRGTGFPTDGLLALADARTREAADAVLATDTEVDQASTLTLSLVNKALDDLRDAGEWENDARREPLLTALRSLKKGRLPTAPADAEVASALDALQAAIARQERAQEAYHRAFAAGLERISEAIRQVPADPHFREAVTWQNRKALHSGILNLLNDDGTGQRNKKQRQQEELIANYLQRYCAKNDTIGFFGPVGWARWGDEGETITAEPGRDLLEKRAVYFEGWCIDTLAQTIGQNKALRPWMNPRRLPFFDLEGNLLLAPSRPPMWLSPSTAAVLQACDGQHTARQLAQELLQRNIKGLQSEEDVWATLEELRQKKLIVWEFEIPLEPFPERRLRRLLGQIEDEVLRQSALAALDELEEARDGVAAAAGDPFELDRALGYLETTFSRLTSTAPTRAHGQIYSGRTLVYEDCRRDVRLDLGPELLQSLGPPLSLLLTSARWFAYQVAERIRDMFWTVYTEMSAERGKNVISAFDFAARVQPHLMEKETSASSVVSRLYQQKWAEVLGMPAQTNRVHYDSQTIRPAILAAFDAPHSGWDYARYHSPDVMIVADSLEAIQRGDYQLVLGEIHATLNTLGAAFWLAQHPSPQDFFQAITSDLSGTHLTYAIPKNWPFMTTRTHRALLPDHSYFLAFGRDPIAADPSQIVPIGTMVITEDNGRLILQSRDGQLRFDLLEAFTLTLTYLLDGISDPFEATRRDGYMPRITIDNLVVARESWQIHVGDAPFANIKDEETRFLEARRWAQARGIPRFAFGRVSVERKPFYVDFDSPVYVNIMAKMIRRVAQDEKADPIFTIAEMLPRLDQTWLIDAKGQRYTSELRLVALDINGQTTSP